MKYMLSPRDEKLLSSVTAPRMFSMVVHQFVIDVTNLLLM